MKTITEYLINNHIFNKQTNDDVTSENIGDRFEINGVPCTLVNIEDNKYYVISDIYVGQKSDGTKLSNAYETNEKAEKYFAMNLWKKPTKNIQKQVPPGWDFPNNEDWFMNETIFENIKKYVIGSYTCTNSMWIKTTMGKFLVYNVKHHTIEFAGNEAGIRFVKIISK